MSLHYLVSGKPTGNVKQQTPSVEPIACYFDRELFNVPVFLLYPSLLN